MKLYGRTQMVPQFRVTEAPAFFIGKGFDGVEISVLDKRFMPRDEVFQPDFPEKMLAAMAKVGVGGYSVSIHKDYTESDETFELACRTLELAKRLGSAYVIINGAVRRRELEYEAQYEAMITKTRELARLAAELGLRLAVEYEPGFVIDSTPKLLKAFGEIDSPVMGINCDIGHVFLCDEDPMKAIEDSAPYILQCHVENMAKGVHNHLVPWLGDMDLPKYIAKLREVGFDGGLGLDLYAYDYAAVCGDCARFFHNIF